MGPGSLSVPPHPLSRAPPGCTLALTSPSRPSPSGAATRCGPWPGMAPPSPEAPCPPPSQQVSAASPQENPHPAPPSCDGHAAGQRDVAVFPLPEEAGRQVSFSIQLDKHLLKSGLGTMSWGQSQEPPGGCAPFRWALLGTQLTPGPSPPVWFCQPGDRCQKPCPAPSAAMEACALECWGRRMDVSSCIQVRLPVAGDCWHHIPSPPKQRLKQVSVGQTSVYAVDENGKLSLTPSGHQGRSGVP